MAAMSEDEIMGAVAAAAADLERQGVDIHTIGHMFIGCGLFYLTMCKAHALAELEIAAGEINAQITELRGLQ